MKVTVFTAEAAPAAAVAAAEQQVLTARDLLSAERAAVPSEELAEELAEEPAALQAVQAGPEVRAEPAAQVLPDPAS